MKISCYTIIKIPLIVFNFSQMLWYVIDADCVLDSKLNPIPIDSPKVKNPDAHLVAFMLSGFHDTCRGCHNELNGIAVLNTRLANSLGYKVLSIPYTEMGARDTLIVRVQYLKESLKNLLSNP